MARVRFAKIRRDLTSNLARTLLVVLSIAVGIFATGSILGARQVLLREFERDYSNSNLAAITFTTSDTNQSVVNHILARSDVALAEGRRIIVARIRVADTESSIVENSNDADGSGKDKSPLPKGGELITESASSWESLELIAVPSFDMSVTRMDPLSVRSWPPRENELIIEASALQKFNFTTGQIVEVDTGTKTVRMRVDGFGHDVNAIPTRFFEQITGYASLDTLGSLGEPEVYNTIVVSVDPALDRVQVAEIATRIKDEVLTPAGVEVSRTSIPKPGSHFFGDMFKAVSVLLLVMALMALALSAFLVVTTVSAILIQHTKQIGIMKAIGGVRSQIARMYFGMVFSFGLIALAIGLPLGIVFGNWFIRFASGVLNFQITDISYPVWVIALLVGIALVLPLIAASLPILSGVKRPIVDAFNANALLPNFGDGFIDRTLSKIRSLPRPVALALRTTFTRKGRLAMTLMTLLLASGVVMAVFSARTSLIQTVDDIGSWWNYDAMVLLSRPTPQTGLITQAMDVPGVTYAETWLDGRSVLNRDDGSKNEKYFTVGYPAVSKVLDFEYTAGRGFEVGEAGVLMNNELHKEENFPAVGSLATVEIAGQEVERKIIGIVNSSLQGPALYFERDDLAELMGVAGTATRVVVKMEQGLQGDLVGGLMAGRRYSQDVDSERNINQQKIGERLEHALDKKGYAVSSTQTSIQQLDTTANQLGILTTFLVIMASALAAVGVIGLTGSMTLSVIESTREIGIMRSIGASHTSIFGIYITQGLVVGTLSWFFGAIISWPLSWSLMQALMAALGMPLAYKFSYGGVFIWLLLVWLISILGSVLPAWRASQVAIRDAIAYE